MAYLSLTQITGYTRMCLITFQFIYFITNAYLLWLQVYFFYLIY